MGPGRDRTRDPWICSQLRICNQTRYRLRYAARWPRLANSIDKLCTTSKRVHVYLCKWRFVLTCHIWAIYWVLRLSDDCSFKIRLKHNSIVSRAIFFYFWKQIQRFIPGTGQLCVQGYFRTLVMSWQKLTKIKCACTLSGTMGPVADSNLELIILCLFYFALESEKNGHNVLTAVVPEKQFYFSPFYSCF